MKFNLQKKPGGITRETPSRLAVEKAESVGLDPQKGIYSTGCSFLLYPLSSSRSLVFTKDGRAKLVIEKPREPFDIARPLGMDALHQLVAKIRYS